MTDSQPTLPLAADFPPASDAQWQELASKALRGKPVSSLRQVISDGVSIDPLYVRASGLADSLGRFPYTRATTASNLAWEIRQTYAMAQPTDCNQIILNELARGVNGIHLRLSSAVAQAGSNTVAPGIQVSNAQDMATTLDGVLPGMVNISLDAGHAYYDAAHWLLNWLQHKNKTENKTDSEVDTSPRATLGADPLSCLAITGQLPVSAEHALQTLAELAADTTQYPKIVAVAVNTSPYHNAGANNVQELGLMLATGKQYLQAMLDHGIPIDIACQQIECRVSVDADFFLMASKLRAARTVWATLCRACGASDNACQLRLHCNTSERMLTKSDAWVNMLRTSVACAAAAIGGADSISVDSFDAQQNPGLQERTNLGRRVARNTQIILQEESGLHRVVDPLGGSGYAEHLSQELSRLAWDEFRAIEAEGGILSALRSGYVHQHIETSWNGLMDHVRVRKQPIVGVSEYANTEEQALAGIATKPLPSQRNDKCESENTLPLRRLSEPFEAIRQQVENATALTPLFTAVLGTPAEYLPRVQFSRNLLAAGGFSMSAVDGTHDIESMQTHLRQHPNKTVVFCAGAATPETQIDAALQALSKAGATNVFIASPPPTDTAKTNPLPEEHYLYTGCDAIALLSRVAKVHKLELS